ncbi:MAG: diaminopimelate decarboxylase [Thermodesulfovibrionales bacterium]|nr:diaminopimelate decarboxylase [Thermodesulfovibrionales bacterium]
MNHFHYVKDELYAEDVPVLKIAQEVNTPVYVYSHATLTRHVIAYQDAFKDIPHIICYALKANSNGAIINLFSKMGCGADIVSGGELFRAIKWGIKPKNIVYAGVGKTPEEIEYALKKNILMFNVESPEELIQIDEIAGKMGKTAPVALRINPDIDPQTHPYISTGLKKHKFGIAIEDGIKYYRMARDLRHVRIVGVHKHIGSQLTKVEPFVDALKRILLLVDDLHKEGIHIRFIDIGGGVGITYNDEEPPHPKDLAKRVIPLLKDRNITLILEPGRSIVGNAGILITKVLYLKKGVDKQFVIVDAGMNDLIRPSIYGAYHKIQPVIKKDGSHKIVADIVGPICESGDFFAKDREIQGVKSGDYIAIMSAGAYGFSMSSNYNSRPRPAEVMVKGNEYAIIRKREGLKDLIRGEMIPKFL